MDEQTQIKDFKGIIRRGKKSFIITASLVFLLAVIIAFLLSPIYRSQSTILIEAQQIPAEYVQSTVTGYVEERLSVIEQRVMSRSKLLEIINRFNLYPDMRDKYTTEEIVAKMREDINRENLSAEVMDPRSGRPTVATIAFALSYEGKEPSTVQKVANTLASIYLEQNLETREQRASTTTDFLEEERKELKDRITQIEEDISEFKNKYSGALPENTMVNLQAVARLENEINQVDLEIRSLEERKIYLEGQVVDVDPLKPITTTEGEVMMNPTERLKALRLQLISLQSTFSDKHPDVKKLKRQIEELEAQTKFTDDAVEKVRRLKDLKGRLATVKGDLGAKHPDVIKLQKEVDLLTQEVEDLQSEKTSTEIAEEKPDNPAYINLVIQIETTKSMIRSLKEEKLETKQKIEGYLAKIEKGPLVEKEYSDMLHELETARQKYSEVMSRLMEARIAQGMEETQRGEKLTIIDPAQMPEKPYKPNRIAIALIGFVLALGAGVGIAAVQEAADTSIKTSGDLSAIAGIPVFSTISKIQTREEIKAGKRKRWIWAGAALAAIILALVLIHFFVMPLDIAWIKIQRRFRLL